MQERTTRCKPPETTRARIEPASPPVEPSTIPADPHRSAHPNPNRAARKSIANATVASPSSVSLDPCGALRRRGRQWEIEDRHAEDGDLVLNLDLTQGPRWLRGKAWAPKMRHKNELGDLKTAGVTRPELFERSSSRQPIRLHDLRATFVTVSLSNGRTEQWVSDRTGHKSSQMIALYARQARTWSELGLGALQRSTRSCPK